MRVLIGVQGTGNGHLSRCSALAEALRAEQVEADFFISGRAREALFDMEVFGNWQWQPGLTFQVRDGKVRLVDTLRKNDWAQFKQSVRELRLDDYDLVLSDFEPVTAWAARKQGKRCIGIGRQFAFYHKHAQLPVTLLQRQLLKQFVPVSDVVGMHWQRLHNNLLPPVIHQRGDESAAASEDAILVYLPFESLAAVRQLLTAFPHQKFKVFHPQVKREDVGHISYFPPSRNGFAEAMRNSSGVIANAGFETTSEALALGKKLLVKPLHGQFEQQVNAHALQSAKLAAVMTKLSTAAVTEFLTSSSAVQCEWPDVASALAKWIAAGATTPIKDLSDGLWQQCRLNANDVGFQQRASDKTELELNGSPGWIRTNDTWINSPPL